MDVADDNEQEDADDEAAQLAAAWQCRPTLILPGMPSWWRRQGAQFSDPSFVNQLLSDLPGVDLNDPKFKRQWLPWAQATRSDKRMTRRWHRQQKWSAWCRLASIVLVFRVSSSFSTTIFYYFHYNFFILLLLGIVHFLVQCKLCTVGYGI